MGALVYPKGISDNLRFRFEIVQGAEKDARTRDLAREMARRDPLFFFNVFLWTYAVVTVEKHVPYVTWDFQDGVIRDINAAIDAQENLFIDKSRDMGATWMVLGVFFWRWLFKEAELFRIGSRKEEYVDQSGNMDTHFEKFRYILDRLPWWMKPVGFEERKHSTYMKLVNPASGSVLVGEATNANFARGGRQTAVLFDEFQNWEKAEEAWRSASDATRCKIALGTPEGAGNKFAELARTEEVRRKIRIWWYLHPKKANCSEKYLELQAAAGKLHESQENLPVLGVYRGIDGKIRSPWYDEQERTRNRDDLAANVDIDYLTTGRPVFLLGFVLKLV